MKTQPFEIPPSKSPDFKCFRISDPLCMAYLCNLGLVFEWQNCFVLFNNRTQVSQKPLQNWDILQLNIQGRSDIRPFKIWTHSKSGLFKDQISNVPAFKRSCCSYGYGADYLKIVHNLNVLWAKWPLFVCILNVLCVTTVDKCHTFGRYCT